MDGAAAEPAQAVRGAGGGVVAAIIAASLTTSITVPPILPKMLATFADVPNATLLVPMVVSLPLVVSIVTAPIIGWLSDRLDRRTIAIWASLLSAGFGVAPYFLNTLWEILVARLLMGFTTAALLVCTSALIGDFFEGPGRRRVLGLKYATLGIAHVFAFIVIGHLAAHDWRNAFWIFLWGLVAAAMVVWFIPRHVPATDGPGVSVAQPIPWTLLAPIFAGVFLAAATFDAVLTGVAFLLEERGMGGTVQAGYGASFASAGMLIGAAAYPLLSSWAQPRHIWIATFALSMIGCLILAAVPGFSSTAIGAMLVGAGCGMVSPNSLNTVFNLVPLTARGRVVGVQTTFFYLGLAVGPLIGVSLGKALPSHAILFWLLAAAVGCIATVLLLLAILRPQQGDAPIAAAPGAI